jgi:hypothetical protein
MSANLPIFQTKDQSFALMQQSWKAAIQPVLSNEVNQGILIEADLVTGNNTINHLLGRKPNGWFIADIDAASTIYRSAAFNSLTLTLHSSANCAVKLWVF